MQMCHLVNEARNISRLLIVQVLPTYQFATMVASYTPSNRANYTVIIDSWPTTHASHFIECGMLVGHVYCKRQPLWSMQSIVKTHAPARQIQKQAFGIL